ncbi:hypothetical protein ACT80S_12970 [Ramlibacter sp. MAHUQ-53]|uniref:hypothetical protein n=1 Tax=unclassified Ramlibacter TaxID=2617605 RepID=UPI0036299F97
MRLASAADLPFLLVGIASAGLAYAGLYHLNAWLFDHSEFTRHINWIFLPAAVRMVAVLVFGWAGVAGLFIGSISVIPEIVQSDFLHAATLATLSSVPALLAARAVQRLLDVPASLAGVTGKQLLCFGVAGGLANSVAHTLYFAWRAGSLEPLQGFTPMLVGDTVGTLLMLYAGAILLRGVRVPPAA